MRILIIEDEQPAAKQLQRIMDKVIDDYELLDVIDSVEAAVGWLKTFDKPDLIFMDIQLADGLSFDIFNQVAIESPVIFTTAFDQYAIQAFKVNSVDYLLKPIQLEELEQAIEKYHRVFEYHQPIQKDIISQMLASLTEKKFKERFLVKTGQQLSYVLVEDIAYFFAEDGLVFIQSKNGKKYPVDYSLDQLEGIVPPHNFFRINRKVLTHLASIKKISPYFNSRLVLELYPKQKEDTIVSRDRVNDFKHWLDG